MSTTNDLYQHITNTIVAAIDAGAGTWQMPWHITDTAHGLPRNAASKKPYRGVNILLLWVAAAQHEYPTHLWATYRQWQTLGAQVQKGEKATQVVLWKNVDATHEDADNDELDEERQERTFLVARTYAVFNAAQVTGYTPPPVVPLPMWQQREQTTRFFAALGADIRHGGTRAYYAPDTDSIEMPPRDAFREAFGYFATLAHEVTHWTGAAHRLNRNLSTRFGDDAYAVEELIAELGAAFLCADLGLANTPRPDHAAYIASWLRVLQKDTRAVFTAASQAQRAADWVHAQQTTA